MTNKLYIWQHKSWPKFTWDDSKIIAHLSQARKIQGKILAHAESIGLETQAEILISDVKETSAIEGEKLDPSSIRSSVARRLGLSIAGLPAEQRNIEGLVEMLMDATGNYNKRLTARRLKGWQAGLFPTGHSKIHKIIVGDWRKSFDPMQVVSGKIGKEKVHYEAPPSKKVPGEMEKFLDWYNKKNKIDGLIRAAIAHFWFVTIHPFEDGNGRIARAITDLALAQDETLSKRCYSLSSQISIEREGYYKILETSQKSGLDITDWIVWFLKTFIRAIENSEEGINRAILVGNFWNTYSGLDLSQRQKKVLQKMLECEPQGFVGGMTNKKYVSITRVSSASAKRDLVDLEKKGLLKRNESGGRSVSYFLVLKK
ncbi:MAG: Fic family protein [Bacteriovorax sp.]